MNKKQISAAIIAAVLFILIGASSVLSNTVADRSISAQMGSLLTGGYQMSLPNQDYVAVVRVEGTIQEQVQTSMFETPSGYQHTTTMEYIDALMHDDYNEGILLYVDSPGGAVYESEELYQKLEEYKEYTNKPIWTYMAHYAASGGYYVSMMSDKIYANPNTTTGSIGVIISGYDLTGLYEKLGIRSVSITSGANKDSSMMTDEQVEIYQSVVDESFNRFVEIVAKGRNLSDEEVRALADGRIYTAKQAQELKLIDEISLYEDMQNAMYDEVGTSYFYELDTPVSTWSSLLAEIKDMVPKSEAEILTNISENVGSGVPMYYAEQLQ